MVICWDGALRRGSNNLKLRVLSLVLLLGGGCDETPENMQRSRDKHDCGHSEDDPLTGIAACTRLLVALDERLMKAHEAYYNRGLAFAANGEHRHAQVDYETVLRLVPSHRFAKLRLEELKDEERDEEPAPDEAGRKALSMPRFSTVGREVMTYEEVEAAKQRTIQALTTGKITQTEAAQEAGKLKRWFDVLEGELSATGAKPKPKQSPKADPSSPFHDPNGGKPPGMMKLGRPVEHFELRYTAPIIGRREAGHCGAEALSQDETN